MTGDTIIHLPEADSTNSIALKLLSSSPPEGTAVCTLIQTKGRGQAGNVWLSEPNKNLALSVIYYPSFLRIEQLFQLSKIAALALQECVLQLLPAQNVWIKWPNDLLLEGKKVAGILIENQLEGSKIKTAIIGIGLNINQQNFPPLLAHKATSLRMHHAKDWDMKEVKKTLLNSLDRFYEMLRMGQHEQINRLYLQRLYGYQEEISVKINGEQQRAHLIGVEPSGKLALVINEKLHRFAMKEVELLVYDE